MLPILFLLIAIAFLSRGSILGVVLTSLFFDALRSGANVMQRSAEVPVIKESRD
ncbi:MAG: hypothetical protein LDL41_26590 [Coleofasciculus sp. S288]|nr:hypothetical protein [Coleofasciculus sp. S288]